MHGKSLGRGLCLVAVVLAAPMAGWASPNDKGLKLDQGPAAWNVDAMIEQASKNIIRRYNLNEEQAAKTREMLQAGVHKFLREHQEEIWPLLRELWEFQIKGELPDPAVSKRIGARVRPLLVAAQKAILEGNEVWGDILSEDQRRLHEFDLNEMRNTFGKMDENFKNWEAGRPVLQPIFPRYVKKDDEPKRPKKPTPRSVISDKPFKQPVGSSHEAWLTGYRSYTERFVKDYALDDTQIEAAMSILREIEARAKGHLAGVKNEEAAISKNREAAFGKAEWDKYRQLLKASQALNAPLTEFFAELKSRLDTIPTEAQRQAFRENLKSTQEPEKKSTKKTGSKESLRGSKAKAAPSASDSEGGGKNT